MYRYDDIDQQIVAERIEQYRDQTRRFLAGTLAEDDFKPLRLQNGLYVQKHAPMLRVAVPYGLLSSAQVRMFAHIARHYDRGYGHFSTRQNIQFNWPKLAQVPDILADLAKVEMHAIQTSGNCIRNITTDHLAGVAPGTTGALGASSTASSVPKRSRSGAIHSLMVAAVASFPGPTICSRNCSASPVHAARRAVLGRAAISINDR